jgi:hypothetical protein
MTMKRCTILETAVMSFVMALVTAALGIATASAWEAPSVISAPQGDEEVCATIYRPGATLERRADETIRLGPGPHLFLDDFLVEKSSGVRRRVHCPVRDAKIPNPIITGKEDGNFQPYMTVLHDPRTGRYRIWYGARTKVRDAGASHVATLDSLDGIHWIRPPRVLADAGPIQFGSSVVDDGPEFADPARRYKLAWWHGGGLMIATSPDGLNFTMLSREPVLRHNHDINNLFRDTARNRYVATVSVYTTGRAWKGQRRVTMHSASRDLVHWEKPWYVLTPDDAVDEGQTQFYAMNGYLIRGGLWIGLVKVLRDDRVAAGTPRGSYGVGYTTLAWSRDGRHWVRDRTPYFEPDPKPGAWDHAHAWLDFQLPVDNEVFIYYGGYKNGHKVNRFEERQIGLVRIGRDRYVSRDAGPSEGFLRTPPVILGGDQMTLNAQVDGRLEVRLVDLAGKPIPGFDFGDCKPILGDSLAHAVRWRKALGEMRDQPLRIEFRLNRVQLYGFTLVP